MVESLLTAPSGRRTLITKSLRHSPMDERVCFDRMMTSTMMLPARLMTSFQLLHGIEASQRMIVAGRLLKGSVPRQLHRHRFFWMSQQTMLLLVSAPTSLLAFATGRQHVHLTRIFSHTQRLSSALGSSASDISSMRSEPDDIAVPVVPVTQLFDLMLPEGRCVGLSFTKPSLSFLDGTENPASDDWDWICDRLHAEEIAFARNLRGASPAHRTSFLLGRLAMRAVLGERAAAGGRGGTAILKDPYGRPTVPAGYLGSISHKDDTAVALAVPEPSGGNRMGIGVDLEYAAEGKTKIARRVLTEQEIDSLGQLEVLTPL